MWMVCNLMSIYSIESRVRGFVHALEIPAKCHMSSEQWAAGRIMKSLLKWESLSNQHFMGPKMGFLLHVDVEESR